MLRANQFFSHTGSDGSRPGDRALGACFTSNVIRFASDFFVHFAGFEGEYLKYLTDKRVKWAEKGDVKMVTGLVKQAPSAWI